MYAWESIMLIFFIFVADEILEQHPDHHVNQASDEVKDVSQVSWYPTIWSIRQITLFINQSKSVVIL